MDFGDLGDLGKNLTVIIPLILLVVFQIFTRKRRAERTLQEVVTSLLNEVNHNQKLMEAFLVKWQIKKFKTDSWKRNKNRIDALGQSVQTALADTFELAEDFNRQMENAKKNKSTSYLANINMDKLKGLLVKSKQALEEWLMSKTGTKEPPPKYPGMLDGLFGRRD